MKQSCELRQDRQALLDRAEELEKIAIRQERVLNKEQQVELDSTLNKVSVLNAKISAAEGDEDNEKRQFEGLPPRSTAGHRKSRENRRRRVSGTQRHARSKGWDQTSRYEAHSESRNPKSPSAPFAARW